MIISCPSCKKRYVIRMESIGGEGRKVRCSSCDTQWRQHGSAPTNEIKENNQDSDIDVKSIASKRGFSDFNMDGNMGSNWVARTYSSYVFLLFSSIVVGLVIFLYTGRYYIVSKIPSIKVVYRLFDVRVVDLNQKLEVNIKKFDSSQKGNHKNKRMVIQGEIKNLKRQAYYLKPLKLSGYGSCHRLSLWRRIMSSKINSDGKKMCAIKVWSHEVEPKIYPNDSVPFKFEISIPEGVEKVKAEF